ncbi:MAG: SHOCT domain-containing protein [Armatimonadota bacterium]|nr:SHOCT domain-containing protein [Armatimonadota bacterium]
MKPRTVFWFALYVLAVLLLIRIIESDVVFWAALALAGGAVVYGIWNVLRRPPLQHNLHQLKMLRDRGQVSADDYERMRQQLLAGRPAKEVFASLHPRG